MGKSTVYVHEAKYDEELYWSRVKRNLGWLGDTESEARRRQEKLRDCTIGIAGCGGIGGSLVERLARLGVRSMKIADFDTFEYSNINRQLGAGFANVGRNKAEVVGEYVHDMTPDVRIEVYPEGISEDTADDFVSGCDYMFDEIEPYQFPARYMLHRAFRKNPQCQFMLTGQVYGNRTFLWKWTHDSMPIEEVIGLPADAELTPENAERLIRRIVPEAPGYPNAAMQHKWLIEETTCPITPGAPPMSQGLLIERLMLAVTGIDQQADSVRLPVSPGYAMMDSRTWTAKTVEGVWW